MRSARRMPGSASPRHVCAPRRPPFATARYAVQMSQVSNWKHEFAVRQLWDGSPLDSSEGATVRVQQAPQTLSIEIEAALHGDPLPPGAPGPTDGLWDYEVVELFLLATDGTYFEFELGPAGHWLALYLRGIRQAERCPLPEHVETQRTKGRWLGSARFPMAAFPSPFLAGNACTIHGAGGGRRYASCAPLPGDKPDFHQPARFPRLGCTPS